MQQLNNTGSKFDTCLHCKNKLLAAFLESVGWAFARLASFSEINKHRSLRSLLLLFSYQSRKTWQILGRAEILLYARENVPLKSNRWFQNSARSENSADSRGEWPSGLHSLRQVTEVKLGRVRSDAGWVTSEVRSHNSPRRPSEGTLNQGSHAWMRHAQWA